MRSEGCSHRSWPRVRGSGWDRFVKIPKILLMESEMCRCVSAAASSRQPERRGRKEQASPSVPSDVFAKNPGYKEI